MADGKKHRKHGRNKRKCEIYRLEGRREQNKARRAQAHQRRMERQAAKAAKRLA